MTLLRTEDITKTFDKFAALVGISVEVKKGEILAIIGPNGAGKTTFLNVVSGKFAPDKGVVYFKGEDITGKPAYDIARQGIARTFQIVSIFPELTVLENIMIPVLTGLGKTTDFFGPPTHNKGVTERALQVLARVGLEDHQMTRGGSLSHGDKRKLDIGIALAQSPELLLLDEPCAGLAPQEKESIVEMIRKLAERDGLSIVLVEHDMDTVFSISDRIIVLHQGRVIAEGKPDEVRNDRLVIEAYLGEDFQC
jgi:branched-chain amino acid transport system ATP-binding protein